MKHFLSSPTCRLLYSRFIDRKYISTSNFNASLQKVAAVEHRESTSSSDDDILYKNEHWQMRDALRKLIDKEINPYVDSWEEQHQFPAHPVFKKLGSAGFLGVNKPTEYGGLGLDWSYSCAVAEELGNIKCGGVPMAIGVQADMSTPALTMFGSDKLKREFLAPTIAGDVVACLGVSEPAAGSDVSSIETRAELRGDDYIINGSKMWITSGCQADWMCLLANTGKEGGPWRNKSLFCVPMKTKGVSLAKKIEKMGMHSSDTAQLYFEDVRIPKDYLIGEQGMGFIYQMLQFQLERLFGTAVTLLPLEMLIKETADYARQRKIFGKPVLDHQVVHFRLAELQTEVEALRSMLYRAVALYVKGHDVTKLASMCKLKAGRLARETTDACMQYWGGMGYSSENIVERMHRDMRLLSIGAGADEVMLSIICKFMSILPDSRRSK